MKTYISYYSSPLGKLRIQCSEEHVEAIVFAAENEDMPEEKHQLLSLTTAQLQEYFGGERRNFELPLKQLGTDFQQKVWQLLLQIPFGKTISYNDLSKQYGDLKAIRAVASANGKNNLAIIVPCHRVIGSNQSLTGYAGGLWRKKWLLEHEAKHHSGVMTMF